MTMHPIVFHACLVGWIVGNYQAGRDPMLVWGVPLLMSPPTTELLRRVASAFKPPTPLGPHE